MEHPRTFGLAALLACGPLPLPQDQDAPAALPGAEEVLDVEGLRALVGGAGEGGFLDRQEFVASTLLPRRDQVLAALCDLLTGDHREVLIRIRALVDALADERWHVREQAERQLGDIGHKGRSLLEKALEHPMLEVRIRAARALEAIEQADHDEERIIAGQVRLLAEACNHLREPATLRPLLAASGHTDERVREAALRALGVLGLPEAAGFLAGRAGEPHLAERNAAVAALGLLPGEGPKQELLRLASDRRHPDSLRVLAVRGLRGRPAARDALARLGEEPSPAVAAAAGAPSLPTAEPVSCRVALLDGGEVETRLLGVRGDSLRVEAHVEGLEDLLVPVGLVEALEVSPSAVESGPHRLFLANGTLVSGVVEAIEGEGAGRTFRLRSVHAGARRIPAASVRGIALEAALDRLVGASRHHDRVRLKTGEVLEGKLVAFSPGKAVLEREGGEAGEIPAERIAGVLLRLGELPPPPAAGDHMQLTRVELGNGERFLGHLVEGGPAGFTLADTALGLVQLPAEKIRRVHFQVGASALWGYTLVVDYSANRVLEVDSDGKVVWTLEDMGGPWDARALDNGNILVTEQLAHRVREISRAGEDVWSFSDLERPYRAQRLPDGNTLIADAHNHRVIEVDPQRTIVWQFAGDLRPFDAERLPDGNTLIADNANDRVIEVDPAGEIVWKLERLESVHAASRLPDGNTLITLRAGARVIEVDGTGKVVFELRDLSTPSHAFRLPNGNTLVAEYHPNGVREFDRFARPIWRVEAEWATGVTRY